MKHKLKDTNVTLLVGFSLLLALMVTQMVASTSEMLSMRNQLDYVVNQKLVKSQLAQVMLDASRERVVLLMMMQYEDDPFKRDDLQLRFQRHAEKFMLAREKLYAMELTDLERKKLMESVTYATVSAEAMNQILETVMEGQELTIEQREATAHLMRERVIPARLKVGELMMEMGWIAGEGGELLVEEAEQGYQQIWNLMWILGGAIFITSLGIIWVVYGRIMDSSSELHTINRELDHAASHDELTGLYNRRTFSDLLDKAIHRTGFYQEKLAILYLDLDGFKAVNDNYGHNSGDLVLQWVSKHFLKQVRDDDVVARLGGDEFAILLSHIHSEASVDNVVERILKGLSVPLLLDQGEAIPIGVSIGVAFFPLHGRDQDTLLLQADHAMYAAKKSGRRRVAFATDPKEGLPP